MRPIYAISSPRFRDAFAIVAGIAAAACGGSSAGGSPDDLDDAGRSLDAGSAADALADGGAAGDARPFDPGVCVTLTNRAPKVTIAYSASSPASAGGGTIADGTYFLTAFTSHGGRDAGSEQVQFTMSIAGRRLEWAYNLGGASDDHRTFELTVEGVNALMRPVCTDAAAPAERAGFTATPSALTLYLDDAKAGGTDELLFTKQ